MDKEDIAEIREELRRARVALDRVGIIVDSLKDTPEEEVFESSSWNESGCTEWQSSNTDC